MASLFSSSVFASIVIWPTNLVIEKEEKATALWLENQGTQEKVIQLRIFKWTQENGKDNLQEQQDIIGSPPMMSIAPGARQMIRVINTKPVQSGQETTYRLLLDEIPTQDAVKPSGPGISFQLRYSVPLFIYGTGLTHNSPIDQLTAKLSWQPVTQGGQSIIEIRNNNPVHVHLSQIGVNNAKQEGTSNALSTYVLPGATIRYPMPRNINTAAQKLPAIVTGDNPQAINIDKAGHN
ncbi:fimbrial biogenesis chaperone [Zophobihabitans entericus]|uniref:Molecular chaperone n=1 Tax=Zophobihabitans entericus TaxID=1635327 RepID=A0A6G9IAA3_9GAMM|nr:molecular chaperone [Zophobihabitans entericus]QIQ20759.1 molecular chaperone [Zophobihabitans entericus]